MLPPGPRVTHLTFISFLNFHLGSFDRYPEKVIISSIRNHYSSARMQLLTRRLTALGPFITLRRVTEIDCQINNNNLNFSKVAILPEAMPEVSVDICMN